MWPGPADSGAIFPTIFRPIAVDTPGRLLALTVTPADQGDREQVAALAEEVQQVTGNNVELAYVDQGYTGPNAAEAGSTARPVPGGDQTPHGQAGLRVACRAAGSSNDPSPGPLDSEGWQEIMNDSTLPSRACTYSPSPYS